MATYSTPDYLGFAKERPKESPLTTAIESGTAMYGELQKFAGEKQRQDIQAEELKQKKMTTEDMPGSLARKKETEEQVIAQGKQILQEGKLKLGALPGELSRKQTTEEQAIRQNAMFLKAYPESLKLGLDAQQLANAQARLTNQVSQMSVDDLKHNHVQNDLADIAEIATKDKDLAAQIYKEKREHFIAMGEDPKSIPQEFDKRAQMEANKALGHSAAAAEERKYQQELVKQALVNKGALAVATAKELAAGTPGEKKYAENEGVENSKFRTQVANTATASMKVKKDTDEMLKLSEKGVGQFGYFTGNTMVLTTEGQENLKASRQLLLDMFAQMPHIGRGGNLLLNIIEQSKPDPKMTHEAYTQMAKAYAAAANYGIEYGNFIEEMKNQGVTDRVELQNAWNRFEANTDVQDKQGNFHPEVPTQWRTFFADSPQALPSSLVKKMTMTSIVQSQGIQPAAQPMPHPFKDSNAQSQNKQAGQSTMSTERPSRPYSVTQTGVVPVYNGQNPTNLLQGE